MAEPLTTDSILGRIEAVRTGQTTVLDLSGSSITDLSVLSDLDQLELLDLDNTQVADIAPLAGLNGITTLSLNNTQVADIAPLAGLNGITELDLDGTQVADIAPLAGLPWLIDLFLDETNTSDLRPILKFPSLGSDDAGPALSFQNCAATRLDPEIKRISEIKDWKDRLTQLRDYLVDWEPPQDTTNIETILRGPILSDTLADLSKPDVRFEATTLTDEPDKTPDDKFADILETVSFAASKLGSTDTQNRLGRDVAQSFREYHRFAQQDRLNPRVLRYLADSIRGAINNPDTASALDDFDVPLINGFLSENDALLNGYYALSIAPPTFEISTDPETLCSELFPKLHAARDILADADAAGLFAPSVSDALEMLHRRAEGARKQLFITDDDAERDSAVAELRRTSVLATSYLGRIKGRLTQWVGDQMEFARENPATTVLAADGLIGVANKVVEQVTPIFEALWKLIGNLPLPF